MRGHAMWLLRRIMLDSITTCKLHARAAQHPKTQATAIVCRLCCAGVMFLSDVMHSRPAHSASTRNRSTPAAPAALRC